MKLELLNSEGPILVAELKGEEYHISNTRKELIVVLTRQQMQEFVHGDFVIKDKQDVFKYRTYPGSMKPDLRQLDKFIGIDTEGKIY